MSASCSLHNFPVAISIPLLIIIRLPIQPCTPLSFSLWPCYCNTFAEEGGGEARPRFSHDGFLMFWSGLETTRSHPKKLPPAPAYLGREKEEHDKTRNSALFLVPSYLSRSFPEPHALQPPFLSTYLSLSPSAVSRYLALFRPLSLSRSSVHLERFTSLSSGFPGKQPPQLTSDPPFPVRRSGMSTCLRLEVWEHRMVPGTSSPFPSLAALHDAPANRLSLHPSIPHTLSSVHTSEHANENSPRAHGMP
ncbi:hypothetical protein CGRA01v4_11659 [Colletotrichum graminicola]|nr:hypothetical protein CGRA01v4_11659 [Colletotrichum graminicola]